MAKETKEERAARIERSRIQLAERQAEIEERRNANSLKTVDLVDILFPIELRKEEMPVY